MSNIDFFPTQAIVWGNMIRSVNAKKDECIDALSPTLEDLELAIETTECEVTAQSDILTVHEQACEVEA